MDTPQRPTPVVFLHSAGLTPQMWQSQVEAVAAAEGTELQVIAPWLAGLRPGRPAELSLANAAVDVVNQLDRYGMKKARLVGHQLGAMAALEVAVTEPERVAGLVLSGALVSPGRVALTIQKGLIRLLPNRAFAESGATKDDLLRALDVIASADLGRRLAEIKVPVLVVAGGADPALPSAKLLVQRLPDARLVEIPGAGVHPNLERPEAYNQALADFLAS
jgi:pimeloyl-ACP methyl ester carboxylesterase